MRCQFCGAEIKEGNTVCEYCGSAAEREAPKNQMAPGAGQSTAKSIVKIIGKVIVSLACIWAVVIVITLIVVLNSDTFKSAYEYSENRYSTGSASGIPQNETGLTGQIIVCDQNGIATIEYMDQTYTDVKILDKDLITWINATDRSLNTVGICFTTDEKGDISELGLLSADFFVIEKDGERYIAVRDEQIIAFTSSIPLETEHCYEGYFSYPDMRLYQGEERNPLFMTYMDPKCSDKESIVEQEYYTGESVTVYKIRVKGKWYYCSKEIYDAVQIDDLLNEYKLCEELAFIVRE